MKALRSTLLLAAALAVATPALADEQADFAIKARQGLMDNFAFNLGQLGAMAKGAVPYDAATAKTAADNLVALTSVDFSAYWPKGTDNAAMPDATHALPEIWEKTDDFMAHDADLKKAALGMQSAAGTDLDALKGAMGPLGKACGGCHKTFRAKMN